MGEQRRIFISVAEDSADLHAARLVEAARAARPGWEFGGLTGPRLRALGVSTVYDFTSHAAMLSGAMKLVGRARRALAAAEAEWEARRPDLVVVMDSSALHLPMAKRARRRGLKVLYYIAPQTWASRAWRNRAIRRDVAQAACILPFEEAYLRGVGVAATFVGHPLFETLAARTVDEGLVGALRGTGRPVVAVLPGSRRHVIDTVLPRQLEVVRRLAAAGQAVTVGVSCVAEDRAAQVRGHLAAGGVEARVVVGDNASLLTAADLVLVASGTATLEVAYYRKPLIVMYDAGRLLHWPYRVAGRLLIRLPHLSLVNILAGARVVPEFMPFIRDTGPIAAVAGQLLTDATWRGQMARQLDEVVRPLEGTRASGRVVELMRELMGDR